MLFSIYKYEVNSGYNKIKKTTKIKLNPENLKVIK